MALNEPCKIMRQAIVEQNESRWGSTENWKFEPHCGCKGVCKRKTRIQRPDEQQIDYGRKKVSRNR